MQNISLKVFKRPTEEIIIAIAKEHGSIADKVIRGMNHIITQALERSDHFCVVAFDESDRVIGYAGFIKNSQDALEWFYTDLWVHPAHRRMGVATAVVRKGLTHLSQIGASVLLCTVVPENHPSLQLQQKIGFRQRETKNFEFFDCDGLIMFERLVERTRM